MRLRRPAAHATDGAFTACSAAVRAFAFATRISTATLVETAAQATKAASFAFDTAPTASTRLRRWPRYLRRLRCLTPWFAQRHHP